MSNTHLSTESLVEELPDPQLLECIDRIPLSYARARWRDGALEIAHGVRNLLKAAERAGLSITTPEFDVLVRPVILRAEFFHTLIEEASPIIEEPEVSAEVTSLDSPPRQAELPLEGGSVNAARGSMVRRRRHMRGKARRPRRQPRASTKQVP